MPFPPCAVFGFRGDPSYSVGSVLHPSCISISVKLLDPQALSSSRTTLHTLLSSSVVGKMLTAALTFRLDLLDEMLGRMVKEEIGATEVRE